MLERLVFGVAAAFITLSWAGLFAGIAIAFLRSEFGWLVMSLLVFWPLNIIGGLFYTLHASLYAADDDGQ